MNKNKAIKYSRRITVTLLAVAFFLFSIDLIVTSLKYIGKETAIGILEVTSNPFIGLFIGLLATAILQSSSTVTSMLVALVASGTVELYNAIPIVMGANIGTTLTNNIVSLSYINKKTLFRRAISCSTSHDFFNILTATILFPLQYYYNILGNISTWLSSFHILDNQRPTTIKKIFVIESYLTDWLFMSPKYYIVLLGLSLIMLFISIKIMNKLIIRFFVESSADFESFLFKGTLKSFCWGSLITATIQSSSVTTSLLVPIVAVGKVKSEDGFPFILGANLGTTITALLAALFKNEAALSLALAHFLFNIIGVLIFLPYSKLRNIPIYLAKNLGKLTLYHRLYGFLYIILVFFLIPFLLILISKL